MSSPQVFGPYFTLAAFLIAAFIAVGREFWLARGLDKAHPLGRVSLAVPIAVFGAEHLTSAQAIMKLVPSWMPGKLFWTYFVGIALIAAALSFTFRVWIPLSATLLGIMFFCFVAMMDLPAVIAVPDNRLRWALLARESAFGSGAILLAITSLARKRTPAENRIAIGALYWIALVSMFYGIEHFLHPECVPAVPLAKVTPLWIPLAHFWTVLTGIALVIGGAAMFARNVSRQSAAALGAWVVLLVVSLYLAIMISQHDIEGLNYFTDTLMFGGVLLLASCPYAEHRHDCGPLNSREVLPRQR
ncbi:MAG TPA: hypothetical protein VEU96_04315 [Bryobacteraceae bacterium]|nr:hypothetical protein [Bryobacteraceae bacterium]